MVDKARREKRKRRNRQFGTSVRPRLSVFRSNRAISCQVIDDTAEKNKVLLFCSSRNINKGKKNCNVDDAMKVGEEIGEKLIEMNITKAVFDRSGFLYHGKVRALAEGVRSKNVKF